MGPAELLIALAVAGFAAGCASGLFGIGGGLLMVPLLLFLTDLSFRQGVAASLLTVTLTVPLGVLLHHQAKNVRWKTGAWVSLGGLVGVGAAQGLDPYLEERALEWAFAALMVYASQRLAYGNRPLFRARGLPILLLTGLGAGFVGKLFGIGGGILVVPALVFGGYDIHAAVATSLVSVFTNSAAGTLANVLTLRPLSWASFALPLAAGSFVGTVFGSRAGIQAHAHGLQRAFAVFLLLMALLLVLRSVQ